MFSTVAAFLAGGVASYAYNQSRENVLEEEDAADGEGPAGTTSAAASISRSVASAQSSAGTTIRQSDVFLSDLLAQLWPYINEAASQTIKESVEPEFKTLPGPLKTLHFTEVNLGDVPIRLDNIVVHDVDRKTNTLQMDLDCVWDGKCDIRLKADYLGSFGVKSVKVDGRMSILMKPLVPTLSIVNAVQVSFINPPTIQLDFVGLANIADMKMLKRRIQMIINDSIKSMLVLPQRNLTKLDSACSFLDIYQPPLGICRLTLLDGNGFKIESRALRKNDVPDCYVTLSVGDGTCKSKTVKNSLEPIWNETMDFVLCDHDQVVHMEVFDEDEGTLDSDDYLGCAEASIKDILLRSGKRTFQIQDDDKKLTGANVNVACQVLQLTPDLARFRKEATGPNAICGMLTVIVTQAFDLPMKKEDVSTHVRIKCGNRTFVTSTVSFYPGVDVLNPYFDKAFHLPLTADLIQEPGVVADVSFDLVNKDETLGSIAITHDTLEAAPDGVLTDKRAIGTGGTMLEFRVILRGVKTNDVPSQTPIIPTLVKDSGTESSAAPSVRVTVIKGTGFTVQTSRRRAFRKKDVPDVYCVIKYGSSPTPWRTKTIKDNLAPVWNESQVFPFLNHGQILHVDCYDEDSGRRDDDDFLGTARITVGKILLAGGLQDVELEYEGKPAGLFITLDVELLGAT